MSFSNMETKSESGSSEWHRPPAAVHPRWFLTPADADPSHSSYQDTHTEHYLFGSGEKLLAERLLEAEKLRSCLPPDRAEEFALRFSERVQELRTEFTATPAPTALPPPPKMSKHMEELRRKRHGLAQARLPTGQEMAAINLRKRTREITASAASLQLPRPRPPPPSSALELLASLLQKSLLPQRPLQKSLQSSLRPKT
jgi:hypothetical protein